MNLGNAGIKTLHDKSKLT